MDSVVTDQQLQTTKSSNGQVMIIKYPKLIVAIGKLYLGIIGNVMQYVTQKVCTFELQLVNLQDNRSYTKRHKKKLRINKNVKKM